LRFTRTQFARAAMVDEKWLENALRSIDRPLRYTDADARWLGLVHLLARDHGLAVPRAARLASEALAAPPSSRAVRVGDTRDGISALVIDVARYHSAFAAALSAAIHRAGPRRRGRPRRATARRDAIRAAEDHGVDVSLLRAALRRSPGERLAQLDANAQFLRALRPRDGSRVRHPVGPAA
jgi:hypothetical protein